MSVFSNPDNQIVLTQFLRKARAISFEDPGKNARLDLTKKVVEFIQQNSEEWDAKCAFNIKHVGEQFLGRLRNIAAEGGRALQDEREVDHAYVIAYRFICEYDLFVGVGMEISHDLRSVKTAIEGSLNALEGNLQSQITYASYLMPASIIKEFLQQPDLNAFKDFNHQKTEAVRLKKEWDEELKLKKDEVSNLHEKLENYKNAFNFVGLYKGFSDLGEKKEKESSWLLVSMVLMAIFILAPLLLQIYLFSSDLINSKSISVNRLFLLIPVVSTVVSQRYSNRFNWLRESSAISSSTLLASS